MLQWEATRGSQGYFARELILVAKRWTPLLIPRDAIFNLVFGEVCSGYFFVVCFRASMHLERESDRANALTAPSSRLSGTHFYRQRRSDFKPRICQTRRGRRRAPDVMF